MAASKNNIKKPRLITYDLIDTSFMAPIADLAKSGHANELRP
jgi:hypothetical protein